MGSFPDLNLRFFLNRAPVAENSKIARTLNQDFPIFNHNPELICVDNGAIPQKPKIVLEVEQRIYADACANVHRAIYRLGEEATSLYEGAR